MLNTLLRAIRWTRPAEFRISRQACSLCGSRVLVRLRDDELGVRCPRCGASAITLSLVSVLRKLCPDLAQLDVYEMSARGPLVQWLGQHVASLTTSEYFEDVVPGTEVDGMTCQDVQALSYPDEQFDLCTSTEVFEHVEDDAAGFKQVLRVLRPGGWFVFTVPLTNNPATIERTEMRNGERVQVLPAEYHADRYRGPHVFCYRNYGLDIVDRLQASGFIQADLHLPAQPLFGHARRIVAAQKPA